MLLLRQRFEWFVVTAVILVANSACGQSIGGGQVPNSGFGSGTGFGSTGLGSSASGFGTGSFGSGFGQGQSGFGQSGLGNTGFGNTGFGGLGMGQGGFDQSAGGFVGRDSSDVTAMFENMTRQGQQFMNRIERSINRGQNADAGPAQTKQRVRVQLKIGFDYPNPADSPMVSEFTARLATLLADRKVAGMSFERDGGNVVVTGTATDDFERMLVEQLIAQQPGITSVTNRMTVGEAIAAPTPQE